MGNYDASPVTIERNRILVMDYRATYHHHEARQGKTQAILDSTDYDRTSLRIICRSLPSFSPKTFDHGSFEPRDISQNLAVVDNLFLFRPQRTYSRTDYRVLRRPAHHPLHLEYAIRSRLGNDTRLLPNHRYRRQPTGASDHDPPSTRAHLPSSPIRRRKVLPDATASRSCRRVYRV